MSTLSSTASMASSTLSTATPSITSLLSSLTISSTSSSASSSSTSGTDLDLNGNAGSAQSSYGQSLSTFVSSLTASLIIFGVEMWVFLILRKRMKRVYEPKTYAVPKRQQIGPAGPGLLDWIYPTLFTSESDFIRYCGLDAYFFIRYLVMLIFIFFIASLVILPILLPINGTEGDGEATGLDRLAWVNVGSEFTQRYWAHLILAIFFIIFVCAVFSHEMAAYIKMRQRYLISPQHRLRASATTVLIRAVPESLLDEEKIKHLFSVFPGGVRNVWINRSLNTLTDMISERDTIARKLESAETQLIQKAYKAHLKKLRKDQKKAKHAPVSEIGNISTSMPSTGFETPAWEKYLSVKDRPTHRVTPSWFPIGIPYFMKKVDTINWCKEKLNTMNMDIKELQNDAESYPLMNSCFIQFNNQIAAHMACQSLASVSARYMVPRLVEINPRDIIWSNMRINWLEAIVRNGSVLSITAALIFGWAFPVAFVGIVSQLSYLTSALPFLDFINDLPYSIKGIISGILPPAALAGLMALLPVILRILARQRGNSTGVLVELTVQNGYFAFLFVQVFLVITIASSITTVIQQLTKNPTSIASLLASNLPKASNFFFSYLILQGLTVSAGALLRIGPLLMQKVLGPLMDNTARQKFTRATKLVAVKWGTFYPIYTNMGAIGLVYTIISPLIIPMCLIAFTLFYIAYRYEFLFCHYNQIDSSGLYFPRAINQLFTGVYVMELCLVGLFFLVRDENLNATCTPHGIIMIIMFFATILFQYLLNKSYGPLITYLPVEIEHKARERFQRWQDQTHVPLLAGKDTVTSYSTMEATGCVNENENEPTKSDMKKTLHTECELENDEIDRYDFDLSANKSNDSADTSTSLDRKSNNPSPTSAFYEFDSEGDEVLMSRLGHLMSFFSKPIAATLNATTGQVFDHVNKGAQKIGISKPLSTIPIKNITDLIYTGNNSEVMRSEIAKNSKDLALLEGVAEDLEDLSPEERDYLVNQAFKHEALRAKTPVIWIPFDDTGVAEDEVIRTREQYPNVLISYDGAALNARGKVVFAGRPPDYDPKSNIAL
ncbi:hypothetical protein V1511DRAFT_494867 [Dipodascopsis uninucleata]